MPDGNHISHILGTTCIKDCVEWLIAECSSIASTSFDISRDPPPHMTSGILWLSCPEMNAVLDIEPSTFYSSVDTSEVIHCL